MSGREPRAARLSLTPVHLVRAGEGLDAVRVQARGFGFVVGSFGVLRVRGALDTVVFRRFRSGRAFALFLGAGLGWASVRLAPAGRASVPAVEQLSAPALPPALSLPRLDVRLTVRPPEPP